MAEQSEVICHEHKALLNTIYFEAIVPYGLAVFPTTSLRCNVQWVITTCIPLAYDFMFVYTMEYQVVHDIMKDEGIHASRKHDILAYFWVQQITCHLMYDGW